MKNTIIGIALALALALVMGMAAFAENVPEAATEPVPAVTEEAPDEPAEPAEPAADDNQALQEALEAYRAAKQSKRVDDLEAEMSEYVASGALTQEQADLILNNVKERMAAKNGECPNCGYQFSNKGGRKGGRGQRGMQMPGTQMPGQGSQRGQRGGRMNGMPQQPDSQSGATPQQPGAAPQTQPNA